jgi:hypothetical protein
MYMYMDVFTYVQDYMLGIRCDIVYRLVLHEENKQRGFILDKAKLLVDLSMD